MGCPLQKLMLIFHEFITPLTTTEVGSHFRLFHASGNVGEKQFAVLFFSTLVLSAQKALVFVYTV